MLKKFLRSLFGILLRLTLMALWACLRLAEIFFGQMSKWVADLISNLRKL